MNEAQILLGVLALADREIQAGKTVPIEEIEKEVGAEVSNKPECKPQHNIGRRLR